MALSSIILPPPDAAFRWEQTMAGPALVCVELAPFARHFYSMRAWALGASVDAARDEASWAEIARIAGTPRVARLRQVHGSDAVAVGREIPPAPPAADVVVTDRPDVVLAVQAADCVPLLVADRRTGAVAAVHAGWRGMAAGAPRAAVTALAREYGSEPRDLVAALGPSIGACCYEVGSDVREAFAAAGVDAAQLEAWFAPAPVETARNRSMPLGPRRPGRWFFDGWACVRAQLEAAGVPGGQIHAAGLCTASHPGVFCSYRREGAAAGRIAGAIRCAPRRP